MHTVAREGLRVRPVTVLVAARLRVRHSSSAEPRLTDAIDTVTHCMVASSVNTIVPFCVLTSSKEVWECVCHNCMIVHTFTC